MKCPLSFDLNCNLKKLLLQQKNVTLQIKDLFKNE